MSSKRHKGRYDAVAIYDGQAWRLFSGGDVRERISPIPSPANKLPQTLVDQAAAAKSRSIRFLVSGDVHRMDGAIPPAMSLDKANEVIRASVAEATGVETDGLLVAGLSMSWGGVRKPFTLACKFDGDMVEDFHATLAEAGIGCAGFASLEMAMLAVWKDWLDGRVSVLGDRYLYEFRIEGNFTPAPGAPGDSRFSSLGEKDGRKIAGWIQVVPDAGYVYLDEAGTRRRAKVAAAEDPSVQTDSPMPVFLTSAGRIATDESQYHYFLVRPYPEADFTEIGFPSAC